MDYATLSSEDLVRACLASGDEPAWAEFIRRFQPLIARVVLRVCRKWGEDAPQTVDDLIQETYLKLCADRARLRTFESTHPDAIYGYLKVFTANLVHDHFKSSRSMRSGGASVKVSVDTNENYSGSLGTERPRELLEREVLINEIAACLHAVSTGPNSQRDQRIFWLYYRVGLPASAIAGLPTISLTTKGVESTILRLTRLVRQRASARAVAPESSGTKGVQATESF